MRNVQKKLWSSWTALSWLDVRWRLAMWRSAPTHPRPAPSWTTTSWRGPESTWEPPGACSSWLDWQKVCSALESNQPHFVGNRVNGNVCFLQELVWRSLLLPSRLYRWLDPCPSPPSVVPQVSFDLQLFCIFSFKHSDRWFAGFPPSLFQLFQLRLQAKLWTCQLSRWPHTAFSSPTSSTHKRKTNTSF